MKQPKTEIQKVPLWLVFLVAFAIVAFWRGIWGLLDLYLFPDNYSVSLIISLVAGICILVLTRYARKGLI